MKLEFTKMTGAGNDFVLVDNRERKYTSDWARLAPLICDRRYGIGADGLLIVEPSDKADFRMLYFNADGSYGGMCGNGGRCIARFISDATGKRELSFDALDYIYRATIAEGGVLLSMKDPTSVRIHATLEVQEESINYHFVNTGSPHVVCYWNDLPEKLRSHLERKGIEEFGRAVRLHDRFKPEGANVNFVSQQGTNAISMRTYERGVESETLACGTGAVACSVISALIHSMHSPVSVTTRSGEILKVHFDRSGELLRNIRLEGPAVTVFRGVAEL